MHESNFTISAYPALIECPKNGQLIHFCKSSCHTKKDGLIKEALNSKGYKRLFLEKRLKQWREGNRLPGNDQLCREAVIFLPEHTPKHQTGYERHC